MLTLRMAVYAATTTICNGYEIDNIRETPETPSYLRCGEDTIAIVDLSQTVELNSDGQATAKGIDGEELDFEFRVSRPMTVKDI